MRTTGPGCDPWSTASITPRLLAIGPHTAVGLVAFRAGEASLARLSRTTSAVPCGVLHSAFFLTFTRFDVIPYAPECVGAGGGAAASDPGESAWAAGAGRQLTRWRFLAARWGKIGRSADASQARHRLRAPPQRRPATGRTNGARCAPQHAATRSPVSPPGSAPLFPGISFFAAPARHGRPCAAWDAHAVRPCGVRPENQYFPISHVRQDEGATICVGSSAMLARATRARW